MSLALNDRIFLDIKQRDGTPATPVDADRAEQIISVYHGMAQQYIQSDPEMSWYYLNTALWALHAAMQQHGVEPETVGVDAETLQNMRELRTNAGQSLLGFDVDILSPTEAYAYQQALGGVMDTANHWSPYGPKHAYDFYHRVCSRKREDALTVVTEGFFDALTRNMPYSPEQQPIVERQHQAMGYIHSALTHIDVSHNAVATARFKMARVRKDYSGDLAIIAPPLLEKLNKCFPS